MEKNNYKAPEQKTQKESGSDSTAAQTIFEQGAKAYGQAEQAVSDAYDKTSEKVSDAYDKTSEKVSDAYDKTSEKVSDAYDKTSEKVSETYEKAKSYSSDNPGKSILIALGIGVGLGFLLGSSIRRSGVTGRFARPVVNALSDIALGFWG